MMENNPISAFFSAKSVSARFKALLELSKDRRQIHEAVKSPGFITAMEWFFEEARSNDVPENILMAAAAISRVSSIIRGFNKNAYEIAEKYLFERLPSLEIIQNPDDRYYIAKTCGMISHDWAVDYLAQAVIEEENAERARIEYVKSLFKLASNLETAFNLLSYKFNQWDIKTEKPAETAARRLKRVLNAVNAALLEYEGDITPDVGGSLAKMVRSPFRKGIEVLEKQDIRKELASEVAETIHNLVRTRFSIATDPLTYEAVKIAKKWFPEYRWEDFTKGSVSMRKVTSDLLESMALLARQGITDTAMFDCLTIVLGSENNARRKTAELGQSLSSLTDDIRLWLITGKTTVGSKTFEVTDLAVKSVEQRENLYLAGLLSDIERLNRRVAFLQKERLAEIEILDPGIAKEVEKFIEHVRTAIDGVQSFCARRGLRIRENINDITDFSPRDHEVITGSTQGVRRVRVIEPVVEKIDDAGVSSVVRKGIVEPF